MDASPSQGRDSSWRLTRPREVDLASPGQGAGRPPHSRWRSDTGQSSARPAGPGRRARLGDLEGKRVSLDPTAGGGLGDRRCRGHSQAGRQERCFSRCGLLVILRAAGGGDWKGGSGEHRKTQLCGGECRGGGPEPGDLFSVAPLCLTLCDPVDCSIPGFPVLHCLLELAQTHVH